MSDDNPSSEPLFRTMKYMPAYPDKSFATLDEPWAWVERFVHRYNHQHLHFAIGFVTPDDRHHGRDIAVLDARRDVYAHAREAHPDRWRRAQRLRQKF